MVAKENVAGLQYKEGKDLRDLNAGEETYLRERE